MKPLTLTLNLQEEDFYRAFYGSLNITTNNKLTPQEIDVVAFICAKPMNFHIDTRKAPTGKSVKYKLAEELKINHIRMYALLKALVKKGAMIIDTDEFYSFPEVVQVLRKQAKDSLASGQTYLQQLTLSFHVTANPRGELAEQPQQVAQAI